MVAVVSLAGMAAGLVPQAAVADEGGGGFWLPGQFGSLAATPQTPGWSLGTVYLHSSVSAGGDVAAARQAAIGRFPGYLSLRGYYEFDASRRPEGWSAWLTFAVSPAAPEPRPSSA